MLNATTVKHFLAAPLHTRRVFRVHSFLDNGFTLFILLVRQCIWKKNNENYTVLDTDTYVLTRIYVGTKFAQIGQASVHEQKVRSNVLQFSWFFC